MKYKNGDKTAGRGAKDVAAGSKSKVVGRFQASAAGGYTDLSWQASTLPPELNE